MILPFTFAFLTWRESIVGMKPTESVQMDIRHTWDILPVSSMGTNVGTTLGGSVESETLGFIRWRMSAETLFSSPCVHLHSEGYDKKAFTKAEEDVWTDADGRIVRQRDVRTGQQGREIGEAVFFPDRIELTRTDTKGKSTFAEVNPAGGMDAVQARFRPMKEDRKEFLRLDAANGSFTKILIERVGHFSGVWGGDRYDGPAYRFTIDGKEQTVMMTKDDEIVQIAFGPQLALVLASPTKSRRKPGFDAPIPSSFPGRSR